MLTSVMITLLKEKGFTQSEINSMNPQTAKEAWVKRDVAYYKKEAKELGFPLGNQAKYSSQTWDQKVLESFTEAQLKAMTPEKPGKVPGNRQAQFPHIPKKHTVLYPHQ